MGKPTKWDVREACRDGDVKRLEQLIKDGAPLDELDIDDELGYIEGQICWRPIHHAARHNKPQCIELLVKNDSGVLVDYKLADILVLKYQLKVLRNAVLTPIHITTSLGVDVNSRTDAGASGLLLACENACPDAARMLIKLGADVRSADKGGQRPLHLACSTHRNLEVAQLMLEHAGQYANDKDSDGWTPLIHAAGVGFTPCVELLVTKYNCDLAERDWEGWHALGLAVANNKPECVKKILELAADKAKTLCDTLANGGYGSVYVAAARGFPECLQLLIDYGAEVNVYSDEGEHPIDAAFAKNHERCIEILKPLTDPEYLAEYE